MAGAPAPRRVAADAPGAVAAAVRVLKAGGVVAYPTEHFYALACNPRDGAAVARLFALKGRAARKPVLLAIADRAALSAWAAPVPPDARPLADAWPEGLTLVLPAVPGTPPALLGGGTTIGLRLVRTPVAAALVRAAGGALPATSANPSGKAAGGDPDAVARRLPGIDLILDAGPLPPGPLSTLLDVTARPWRVLRAGAVPRAALAAFGPIADKG